MKSIKFIRHYIPQKPFDNWRNMSWTEFKRLTEGFADPCISLIGLEESIKDELQQGDFELIITGTNRRTSETGKYIKKYLLMKSTLIQ